MSFLQVMIKIASVVLLCFIKMDRNKCIWLFVHGIFLWCGDLDDIVLRFCASVSYEWTANDHWSSVFIRFACTQTKTMSLH